MFKNNRTNFQALIENLKEKARLNKEKRAIKRNPESGKGKPKPAQSKRQG